MIIIDDFLIDIVENKIDKRYLKIIEYLYYSQKHVSINTLAQHVKANSKTIHEDIKELIRIYDAPLRITNNNKEVLLDTNLLHNLSEIGTTVFNKTIACQLLDGLYRGVKNSQREWSEVFHISLIHFLRKITYFNEILADYNIKLIVENKVLTISGPEECIRYYFFIFYVSGNVPIFTGDQGFYESICDSFVEESLKHKLPNLKLDYYHIVVYTKLLSLRLLAHKHITLDKEIVEKIEELDYYQHFKKIYLEVYVNKFYLEELTKAKLPEEEIIYSYLIQLDNITYINHDSNSNLLMINGEDITVINTYSDFIDQSISQFIISENKESELKSSLVAYLINISKISLITPLYQKRNTSIKRFIKEYNKDLYKYWYKQMNLFNTKDHFNFAYPEDIAISLTMLSYIYLDFATIYNHNILVCLTGASVFQEYLNTFIKQNLLPNVEYTVINDTKIDQTLIDDNGYNVLITNANLIKDLKNVKQFNLSNIPSTQDFETINAYINRRNN